MAHRSRLSRNFGIAFAFWFSVFQTEPAAVHACAMHNGGSGHGAHGTVSAPATDAHAGHALAAADGGAAPTQNEPAATCTCPGGCAAASSVGVPRSSEAAVAVGAFVDAAALPQRTETVRASGSHVVLPFANGPPTV